MTPGARYETVDDLLARAQSGLRRLESADAAAALRDGAILIDIRSESQREQDGVLPGAVVVPRNVLEWRCDPACAHRDERIARRDRLLIIVCDEGYQSSLAAANLIRPRAGGVRPDRRLPALEAARPSGRGERLAASGHSR